MPLTTELFQRQKLDDEKRDDVITLKLNEQERALLERMKGVLEQEKDSTCIKQLAWLGTKVLLREETSYILETIFSNKRKNRRLGIQQFET